MDWLLSLPGNQVRPGGKPRSAIHELLVHNLLRYGDQAVKIGSHQLWCNVEYLKVAVLDAPGQLTRRRRESRRARPGSTGPERCLVRQGFRPRYPFGINGSRSPEP